MAIVINRTLQEGASTICFEVTNDSGGEGPVTIADVATLNGAGPLDNQSLHITRVVATVAAGALAANSVTLSWGDGSEFLHLPSGTTDLNIPFRPVTTGGGDGNIILSAAANTLFTLRIYAKKAVGYTLSMAHAGHRP
jgi:hypothetical protein